MRAARHWQAEVDPTGRRVEGGSHGREDDSAFAGRKRGGPGIAAEASALLKSVTSLRVLSRGLSPVEKTVQFQDVGLNNAMPSQRHLLEPSPVATDGQSLVLQTFSYGKYGSAWKVGFPKSETRWLHGATRRLFPPTRRLHGATRRLDGATRHLSPPTRRSFSQVRRLRGGIGCFFFRRADRGNLKPRRAGPLGFRQALRRQVLAPRWWRALVQMLPP